MRLEIKCPFCSKLICKMAKGSEIEIHCRHCKGKFVLNVIDLPSQQEKLLDSS